MHDYTHPDLMSVNDINDEVVAVNVISGTENASQHAIIKVKVKRGFLSQMTRKPFPRVGGQYTCGRGGLQ